MRPQKTIPQFKTEGEEREFWESNDALDYFNPNSLVVAALPNLRSRPISKISDPVGTNKNF